ncbi:hypothetical protein DSL72_003468 [Monilinia vaccinii-corymbosi]|uniref:WSC domain-containing protein n=1 Tax=Monilinia vaccinii-corymbosi TaxID=61207 RepID=A0A8A3P2E5_9HELO|nr:hypothetical protein DSL72_003468 [Monilinia vaccinii-corymbosi]
MTRPNLFIAFLGITSVIAANVCIEALLSEPGDAKDFCVQYLLLSTIPVPSFALQCLGTNPSDNQLSKSCDEVLTRLAKEAPLPTALHSDAIESPSRRGESLARGRGFFNTGSVSSVPTNAGTYHNVGCFEDGVRRKPLGSPLLNLTGGPAETIQSCANACSISGRNGIPYLYAGVEPGVCWCSNYISILSIKSSSFCQSSCLSTSGEYCGGTDGGVLYMQVYELKNWSGNVNPTSTTSANIASSSSLKYYVRSSSLTSQSQTFTSSPKGQPPASLIPDPDVPPRVKAKPKGKLHRRQIGSIPENALEPPGRPGFIKEFPEKNSNKPLPPPFDKVKDTIDPKKGKKIQKKKPKNRHSKISLKKRPGLQDIGLQQDGRKIDEQGQIEKADEQKTIKSHRDGQKLHLQGIPKAYGEMEEEIARRERVKVKNTVEEWEKKILWGFETAKEDRDENDPPLGEDAIIRNVLLNDEEGAGIDEEGDLIWRKWSGGKSSNGRKIRLEKV